MSLPAAAASECLLAGFKLSGRHNMWLDCLSSYIWREHAEGVVANTAQLWQLQDAKNRFSAVVDAALGGEPQHVTRRGQPVVVVVAVDEFERLCRLDSVAAPTFGRLLTAIPTDDGEFERLEVTPRDIEL